MKRGVGGWACLLLAGVLVAGCGGSNAPDSPAPSAPAGGVAITARNTAFDRSQLDVPAGRPFELLFENREGLPHNIRIYDEGVDQALFVGETFSGPGSRTYQVSAIPAGTHKFRCDVHPQMTGTVTAG